MTRIIELFMKFTVLLFVEVTRVPLGMLFRIRSTKYLENLHFDVV